MCPATSTINHNFESIDPQPSLAAVGSRTTPHGCKYQCRPCGRERKRPRLNKRPGHAVTGIRFPTARARGGESQREPTVRRYGQCQEALQRAALFRVTISGTAGRPPASFGPLRFFFAECSKTGPEVDPRGGPNRSPEDDRQSEEDANQSRIHEAAHGPGFTTRCRPNAAHVSDTAHRPQPRHAAGP